MNLNCDCLGLKIFNFGSTGILKLPKSLCKIKGDSAVQNNIKELKRGELLFKEGDPIEKVYFVQSGRLSLFVERNGKKMEVDLVNASQTAGEQGVLGVNKQPYSAEAQVPTKGFRNPHKCIKVFTGKFTNTFETSYQEYNRRSENDSTKNKKL